MPAADHNSPTEDRSSPILPGPRRAAREFFDAVEQGRRRTGISDPELTTPHSEDPADPVDPPTAPPASLPEIESQHETPTEESAHRKVDVRGQTPSEWSSLQYASGAKPKDPKMVALAEAAALRAMWERAQTEIDRERKAFNEQMASAARAQSARRLAEERQWEVRQARATAGKAPQQARSGLRSFLRFVTAAIIAAVLFGAVYLCIRYKGVSYLAAEAPKASAPAPPPVVTVVQHPLIERPPIARPTIQQWASSSRRDDFSSGLDRLDDALRSFPDQRPEDVLRRAWAHSGNCGLEWHGGSPDLLFGGGQKSLTGAISACADAVEQMSKLSVDGRPKAAGR